MRLRPKRLTYLTERAKRLTLTLTTVVIVCWLRVSLIPGDLQAPCAKVKHIGRRTTQTNAQIQQWTTAIYCGAVDVAATLDGSRFPEEEFTLRARVKRETLYEQLLRLLPRSSAERTFKRKTRLSSQLLVMNGGFVFKVGEMYTTTVEALTDSTSFVLVYRASLTELGPSDLNMAVLNRSWNLKVGFGRRLSSARTIGGPWFGPPWREDPRISVVGGKLLLSYTVTSAYERNRHAYQVWQRQAFAWLSSDFCLQVGDIFLPLGNNSDFLSTVYPHFEKNWLFFEQQRTLHVLYSVQPFLLYKISDLLDIQLATNTTWSLPFDLEIHGQLRGGAPPVLLDGTWFAFVHSKSYHTFVVGFSDATLQLTHVPTMPVLDVDADLFVCGAVFVRSEQIWYLSLGVADRFIAVVRVAHDHVLRCLVHVP